MKHCLPIDGCIKKIFKYLNSENDHQPIFVNIESSDSLKKIKEELGISVIVKDVSDYCNKDDENPQLELLLEDLKHSKNNKDGEHILLTGLISFLKMQGGLALEKYLSVLITMTLRGKLVVLCYQAKQYLQFPDIRFERRIIFLEDEILRKPKILFINKKLNLEISNTIMNGIRYLLKNIEISDIDIITVSTSKSKQDYPNSLFKITEITDAYDALVLMDAVTELIPRHCGTNEQWDFALSLFSKERTWNHVFTMELGESVNLYLLANKWSFFNTDEKWLYFIALKLNGISNNWCLDYALINSNNVKDFEKNIYRSIVEISHDSKEFDDKYDKRKRLIKEMGKSLGDGAVDYCQYIRIKGSDIIYYLTDNTQVEKELIIECLCKYKYDDKAILSILKIVYPALADYLYDYRFNITLLDEYFQLYKYQKITNTIRPEFEELVKTQAIKREYNSILPFRSEKIEAIVKKDSYLYFVDAMSVEYLGYILTKCKNMELMINVTVCHSNLPSITECNKEFLDEFTREEIDFSLIKELDEIKHHGKDDFDYQKTKLPIHLIRELEIIDEILSRAKNQLNSDKYKKIIIISDHGASRLAVIKENTLNIDVNSKGTHGGRCCAYTPDTTNIEYATQEGDYYILANYDRFRGGRAASVETHGGATLEEVVIPIIELTQRTTEIEIEIVTRKIFVSFRKKAVIVLFSKTKLSSVSICINGQYYHGIAIPDNKYIIDMPDIKQAGIYTVDVYENNNLLKNGLSFEVEKEGSKITKLF
ncbi:MAG: BREX-4 system phosphatase PglZ [Fusobacteriaceae bacterium]|jgi:hypothetical protein|nr:BREX-4 system phosphatase PglZ [Fusobacteriaceae bacterium]